MGTKELAEFNAQRTLEYLNMTPQQRKAYHKAKYSAGVRRGRPKLPAEEKKRRQREVSAAWYEKNKEKHYAMNRARKLQKRAERQAAGGLNPIA